MICCLQLRVIFVVSFSAKRFNALDLETSIYMQLSCRPKLFLSVIFCSVVCQSKFTKAKAQQQNGLKHITFYVNQLVFRELLFLKLLLENNILLIVIGYLRCTIQKRGKAHTCLLSPQTIQTYWILNIVYKTRGNPLLRVPTPSQLTLLPVLTPVLTTRTIILAQPQTHCIKKGSLIVVEMRTP